MALGGFALPAIPSLLVNLGEKEKKRRIEE
jgi:hypothetical protein